MTQLNNDDLWREVSAAQILEGAPDAMIVVADGGTIVYVNSETEKLFGYTREELLGQAVEVLIPETLRKHHVGHRQAYAEHPRPRAMGQALNIVGRRKDGTEFPADVKLGPLQLPSGLLVTAAVRDMTEARQAAEKLQKYACYLEELQAKLESKNVELSYRNRELEQFAYVSSHDLQEPLRKIVAFGDRLKTRCSESLDERGLDYLERIQGAARRMQLLINDLLTYSRLSTRAKIFVPVDLGKVAEGIVSDLEIAVERSGGRVEIGELMVVEADPLQMRQLIQNLIGNALKFRREGVSPHVKLWGKLVEPEGTGGTPKFEIYVQDNGIGIEAKYCDRIFTVFERLNPRGQYEGTGIGLAICKRIAEIHGGEISVSSEPGQGSTFVVRLPVTREAR